MRRNEADAGVVRMIRSLRAFERRIAGGSSPVWDVTFSDEEGARVRFPLRTLVAFDRESRRFAIESFYAELFGLSFDEPAAGDASVLRERLGLDATADPRDIRRAFRDEILRLHPDTGSDDEGIVDLIDLYRTWQKGGIP